MNRIAKVTRLHLNKPQIMFAVPLYIIGLVVIVSAIISLVLQRIGLDPSDPAFAEGARMNFGVVWSLPGFLVYLGVQAVATTFPFALALGAARRNYVFGTAIANLIQAAYVSVCLAVLLGIELLTGHWFASVYVLDNILLGSGDVRVLLPAVFIAVFALLSVGGAFGAVWVRFGSKGPTVVALILALVLAVLLLILAPVLGDIVAAITRPGLALFGAAVAILALLGTWAAMRRASVR